VLDQVTETTGIRSFLIDDEQGFILNGKPYRLCGVNRHQDRENVGWAIGPKEHKEDFALIQEIGATAVRLAHYQHAKEFYALCDRGGMVVWAELALVDEILPNEQFRDNLRHQLTELIKQNYNHPAICFWSLQNELVPDNDRTLYGNIVEELHLLARALDSTRPTTVASRSKYDPDEKMNSVSDLLAYNVYRGWYEGKPEGFAAFADRLHAKYPQRKMAISEYGAGAGIHQHEWPVKKPAPRGAWHPEEWQSVVHEITWKAIEERTYLWGSFLWNMFDFGSDGRSEGEQTGQNDKGLVSYDRKIKKDAFFFYKAHWNPEPMVYITSRRYNPRPEGITTVKAYANCEAVELFVNGKSFGKKTGSDHIYVWDNVALSEGTARVSVVGTVGTRRLKDSCEWVVVSAGR
jgi:beta-galactosidase